ncbi:MAG: hypothetical protein ACYC67_25240 [Prosthecobacter sp.]
MDTLKVISSLRKYLESMEVQMELLYEQERRALMDDFSGSLDEDDIGECRAHLGHLEDRYEQDLKVTMRYSFVVFTHIVFETRFVAFCKDLHEERKLPMTLKEFKKVNKPEGTIKDAKNYLKEHARLDFGTVPEWCQLMNMQKIRDCIVHTNGVVDEMRDDKKADLLNLIYQKEGIALAEDNGRLALSAVFCQQQVGFIDGFFRTVFKKAGWKL